jgi:hypothetical protein
MDTAVLRVINYQAGKRCRRTEKQVSWNQKGPKGGRRAHAAGQPRKSRRAI